MVVKKLNEGRIYVPETEEEKETLDELVKKGLVEFHEGGYWLNKTSRKINKDLFKKEGI